MSVNQKVLDAFVEDFWNDSVEGKSLINYCRGGVTMEDR